MNYAFKALDYYRGLFRQGGRVSITGHSEEGYWVADGFMAHLIPDNLMDLNPALLKNQPLDINSLVEKAERGTAVKKSGISKEVSKRACRAFESSDKTLVIWFDSKLLNSFPKEISLIASSPLDAAVVKLYGKTIGIILPVRPPEPDMNRFL
jgi:hypothetical protein